VNLRDRSSALVAQPHRPRKRFGQHFLIDRNVAARIIAAIAPQQNDQIVEIGPGQGALTAPLLDRVRHLDAVEIDRDLAKTLKERFAGALTVHVGDALKFDFAQLGPALRVVGNLPYNISTPLLFHLAGYSGIVRDMHLMLQKEVALRITAQASTPDYGRLSVALQYQFRVERLFNVSPQCFRPAPKVESALVRLAPLPPNSERARDESLFNRIVTHAFTQRRKVLTNSLAGFLNEEDFEQLLVPQRARAENLAVGDFVKIANYVEAKQRPAHGPPESL
jgi:16S rRNA (adenine1518-N6/adenine1519-N6)-dimethyltransferase